jgi:hypothetical protein
MDAEQTVRQFMAAVTADIAEAAEFMAADFVVTGMGPEPVGRDMFLENHDAFNRAMPDRRFVLSDVHTEGKVVSAMVGLRGTHTGVLNVPLAGIEHVPPTHRQVDLPPALMTFTLHEGKVAAIDAAPSRSSGLVGMLDQLGVKV